MESDRLLVLYPQKRGPEKERSRMDEVLRAALDGIDTEIVEDMEILEQDPFKYRGRRLLFAVPLGRNGINRGYYEVLAWLRGGDQVLAGATAGMIIDAESEFYTKATARELAVAANRAGCAFVGRPLVEGTASLDNYLIQAANMNTDRFGAYKKSAAILAHQILEETWQPKEESHLLVLHASPDLQYTGDLAESKGAPGRPDQDSGDQPAKRHSRGLFGMSIPDVPALW